MTNRFDEYHWAQERRNAFREILRLQRFGIAMKPVCDAWRIRLREFARREVVARRVAYQSAWDEATGWVDKLYAIAEFRDVQLTWAEGYAEPGADECKWGIVIGNWNNETRYDPATRETIIIDDTRERLAELFNHWKVETEWEKNVLVCGCGKAFVCQPGHVWWTMYGYIGGEDYACGACVNDDPDEYLEHLAGNPDNILSDAIGLDLSELGWTTDWTEISQDDAPLGAILESNRSYLIAWVKDVSPWFVRWTRWDTPEPLEDDSITKPSDVDPSGYGSFWAIYNDNHVIFGPLHEKNIDGRHLDVWQYRFNDGSGDYVKRGDGEYVTCKAEAKRILGDDYDRMNDLGSLRLFRAVNSREITRIGDG